MSNSFMIVAPSFEIVAFPGNGKFFNWFRKLPVN